MNAADRDRLVAILAEIHTKSVSAWLAVRSQGKPDPDDRRADADVDVWLGEIAAAGGRLDALRREIGLGS